MKHKLFFTLAGVTLVLGWLWFSKRSAPSDSTKLSKTPTQAETQPPSTTQPAVTNIPGIGPVPTDPKELERFKAKAKREMQSALRTVGVFSNREDMKQAQDNGELAWIFIEQRKNLQLAMDHIHGAAVEPYPPRMLEALEHILKHSEEAQLKLTAATLLYRYGQPAGKEYLLAVLNSPNVDLRTRDVIKALAMNREVEAVVGISMAFSKLGSPPLALQSTVGRWGEPSIIQAVRQQYGNDPRNWGYALGLSQADDPTAIEPLRMALKSRGNSASSQTIECALAHLGAIEPATWASNMDTAFQNRARVGDQALLSYLDIAGPAMARGVAQEFLKACIPLHEAYLEGMELQAKGIREKIPELANKFPKPSPYEFMMGAAQLLAQWDAKEAVPTLQQVLTTVQKGNRSDVYLNEALGLALYKLDPANWRDTMANAGIPPYHIDRIPELAKLRPIPAEYMPKQVNLRQR